MSIQRPCSSCSGLIHYSAGVSRCSNCESAYQARRDAQRGSSYARGYDGTYRLNSAKVRAYAKRNGLPCELCREPFAYGETISVDHIQPVSLGGSNELENLRPCHLRCNASRGNKPTKRDNDIGPA